MLIYNNFYIIISKISNLKYLRLAVTASSIFSYISTISFDKIQTKYLIYFVQGS